MKYILKLYTFVEKINKILLPQMTSYVHMSIHIHNPQRMSHRCNRSDVRGK